MKIQTFSFQLGLLSLMLVSCYLGEVQAQTVTDKHGTEILMEALHPVTRSQVQQTRSVQQSGGEAASLPVDGRGRVDLQGKAQSDTLLVKKLHGVVLLPNASEVRSEGWTGVKGVWHDFEEFPTKAGFAIQKYVGKPVSLASLDKMVASLAAAYRDSGRPGVSVILPEQDITSGVVQLVVAQ